MKDEEMARLFIINKYDLRKDLSIYAIEDNYELGREYYAFLAGLKAGRPQLHDLRKDPNDLPKDKEYVLVYTNLTNCYVAEKVNDHFMSKGWGFIPMSSVIAWCEKPTFDKE